MKRVVIYVDGSANDTDSLTSAALFCRRVGARLDVVHLEGDEKIIVADYSSGVTVWNDTADLEARAATVREAFAEVFGDSDLATLRQSSEDALSAIRRDGLVHDAVILERLTEEDGPLVSCFNTAVFEVGVPVLIAPPRAPAAIGEVVALMWSATPASARALRAALPLLEAAGRVVVMTNSANEEAVAGDVATLLEYHGVSCESHEFDGESLTARGRGRAVLAAAAAVGADTLVVGAHGESRLEALVGLGRATQKIVTAAVIPVLLHS